MDVNYCFLTPITRPLGNKLLSHDFFWEKIVYCSFLEKLWISDAKAHLVLGTQDDDVGSVSQVSKVAQVKSQRREDRTL